MLDAAANATIDRAKTFIAIMRSAKDLVAGACATLKEPLHITIGKAGHYEASVFF